MTFDKGGRWSRIKAPSHDSLGKESDCSLEDGCSLHLHGVTDEWGPFYSPQSALGLILATGNTGRFLDMFHGGSVNTYFSRDAGQVTTTTPFSFSPQRLLFFVYSDAAPLCSRGLRCGRDRTFMSLGTTGR